MAEQKVLLPSGLSIPVAIKSVFIPGVDLKQETIDAIRNATETQCLEKAAERWGQGQIVTVRDLNGTDMGYPNNIFVETSNAGANAWNAMAVGPFVIALGTIIGIYGLRLGHLQAAAVSFAPITGVRIDVGGARVAQWMTQCVDSYGAGTSLGKEFLAGFTKSPIVAQETMTVTIFEYTRTATQLYNPVWAGVVIEKLGITLRP